jgi:preprotein translocase subunit SecE
MNETVNAIKTYFKGVKSEWSKISWPEKRQVIFETFSVIVIVTVFTVAIYVMDLLFRGILGLIKLN